MRYLLVSTLTVYAASVLSCPAAFGAIALVANATAGSSNTTSVTTAAIDTTGASLLVAGVSNYTGGTLTDSMSNTWTLLTGSVGGVDCRMNFYYAKNATVGVGHTFTFSNGTATYPAISVTAWSGADPANPFDVQSRAVASGLTSSIATGTITPGSTNELWVSVGCSSLAETSMAPAAGARINITPYGTGTNFAVASSY